MSNISDVAAGFRGKHDVFKKMAEMVLDKEVKAHLKGKAETYLLCALDIELLSKDIDKKV